MIINADAPIASELDPSQVQFKSFDEWVQSKSDDWKVEQITNNYDDFLVTMFEAFIDADIDTLLKISDTFRSSSLNDYKNRVHNHDSEVLDNE